uniref:ARID DNA-binding domain-containing protein n=1 Tax=Tanacetum cinerariifolium TaxID=118510 RepID=A0A6L2P5A1_TANCI|nr:ARID DNA-binding domain-containing protein [Tanacetum cinerariifolium]
MVVDSVVVVSGVVVVVDSQSPRHLRDITFFPKCLSLEKIALDVDFFMERETSPSTNQFFWSFIDSKLFSRTFITSNLFSGIFNTSKLSFEILKNAECSNCKHLLDKITVLKATVEMYILVQTLTKHIAVTLNMSKLETPLRKKMQYGFIQRQLKRERERHGWTKGHIIKNCLVKKQNEGTEIIGNKSKTAKVISEGFMTTKPTVSLKYPEWIHFETKFIIKSTDQGHWDSICLGKIALDVDFLWKKERVRLLTSSSRASSTLGYSPGPLTPPSYSSGSLTPQSYSSGSSRNAECSNCKHLLDKIMILKETVEMYMHPEQHTVNSAAILHEVYNDMGKLDLE